MRSVYLQLKLILLTMQFFIVLLVSGQTDFSSNYQTACLNQKVFFAPNNPTGTFTWNVTPSSGWSFVNGTSASSTYPVIAFTTLGVYDITMQVGGNIVNKCKYIKAVQSQDNLNFKTEGVWNGFSSPNISCVNGAPAFSSWDSKTGELNFNNCQLSLIEKPNPNNLLGGASEISSTISNIDGNELFYLTGYDQLYNIIGQCTDFCSKHAKGYIYNRNHEVMKGVTNKIFIGSIHSRGNLSLPMPGSCNSKYFVFTLSREDYCWDQPFTSQNKAYFHIIDMNGDNGLGEAISINNQFDINVNECITAVSQPNGYWIIVHDGYKNEFRVYELTASGFNTTPIQIITTGISRTAPLPQSVYYGEFKVSPKKDKLAFAWFFDTIGSRKHYIEIFDFNNSTGFISNPINVFPTSTYSPLYGLRSIEFSPNSNYVFTVRSDFDELFRVDLTSNPPTYQSIPISTPNASEVIALELAPNGKILISKSDNFIGAIENPNVASLSSLVINQSYIQKYPIGASPKLGSNLNNGTLTREILYEEGLLGSTREKYICPNSTISLSVNPTISITNPQWYSLESGIIAGAANTTLNGISQPGYYYFTGINSSGRTLKAYTLVKDYSCYDFGLKSLYRICPGSTINVQAKFNLCEAKTHRWYNSVTGILINSGPPPNNSTLNLGVGKYYLQVETFSGCFLRFDFEIKDFSSETAIVGDNIVQCNGKGNYEITNFQNLGQNPSFSWSISPAGPIITNLNYD